MRIRTIKPEWLEDERVCLLSAEARVMSVALILMADDHGNGRAHPRLLAGRAFPGLDASIAESAMTELEASGYARRYTVDDQVYFAIRNWSKHQRIDNAGAPRVPPPPELVAESRGEPRRTSEDSGGTRLEHRNIGARNIGPGPRTRPIARVGAGAHVANDAPETPVTEQSQPATRLATPAEQRMDALTHFELVERMFGVMRRRCTKSVWRRSHVDYSAIQSAAEWVQHVADSEGVEPKTALGESLTGFASDQWAKTAGFPLSAWARDPGKYRDRAIAGAEGGKP